MDVYVFRIQSLHRCQNYNFSIVQYSNIKIQQIFEHFCKLVRNDELLSTET